MAIRKRSLWPVRDVLHLERYRTGVIFPQLHLGQTKPRWCENFPCYTFPAAMFQWMHLINWNKWLLWSLKSILMSAFENAVAVHWISVTVKQTLARRLYLLAAICHFAPNPKPSALSCDSVNICVRKSCFSAFNVMLLLHWRASQLLPHRHRLQLWLHCLPLLLFR